MSQIRTAKAGDVGAFPGSAFVVDGSPPIAQCQETEISGATGSTNAAGTFLFEGGKFAAINLADKILSITAPAGNIGDYTVVSNNDNQVNLATPTPVESDFNVYTVHDAGQAYLTRNEPSFQRFIEAQGKAHTTKGGHLFTDVAAGPMAGACSDTFNPQ